MAQRLPDRSFVGPGLKSAWFVFSRPWVLWPSLAVGLAFGGWLLHLSAQKGRLSLDSVLMILLLVPVCGLGAAVLTTLPGFMLYRAFTGRRPPFAPDPDETVLHRGAANHSLGNEGRGGKLVVTSRRLVFQPHRFNVQLAPLEIALGDLKRVAWGRIVSSLGQPMSAFIELDTAAGTELLIVGDTERLARLIDEARASIPPS